MQKIFDFESGTYIEVDETNPSPRISSQPIPQVSTDRSDMVKRMKERKPIDPPIAPKQAKPEAPLWFVPQTDTGRLRDKLMAFLGWPRETYTIDELKASARGYDD